MNITPTASKKVSIHHHIKMAWDLINLLSLNGDVQIGDKTALRFSLVDSNGYSKKTPDEAVCIFDMSIGKSFLPQTDPDWFDQLTTRFRVGVQWSEDKQAWEASAGQEHGIPAFGYGQTPGVAVVEALVVAARSGKLPTKHPYPDPV